MPTSSTKKMMPSHHVRMGKASTFKTLKCALFACLERMKKQRVREKSGRAARDAVVEGLQRQPRRMASGPAFLPFPFPPPLASPCRRPPPRRHKHQNRVEHVASGEASEVTPARQAAAFTMARAAGVRFRGTLGAASGRCVFPDPLPTRAAPRPRPNATPPIPTPLRCHASFRRPPRRFLRAPCEPAEALGGALGFHLLVEGTSVLGRVRLGLHRAVENRLVRKLISERPTEQVARRGGGGPAVRGRESRGDGEQARATDRAPAPRDRASVHAGESPRRAPAARRGRQSHRLDERVNTMAN